MASQPLGTVTTESPPQAGAPELPPETEATQRGDADVETSELWDFSRTVAEIEWLLVICSCP